MSWLTGLAGKAEELLNRVDQSAAQALQNEGEDIPAPGAPPRNMHMEQQYSPYLSQTAAPLVIKPSASVPSNLNRINKENQYLSQLSGNQSITPSESATTNKPAIVKYSPTRTRKKDKDEELFEFLNTPETSGENGGKNPRKDRPTMLATNGHSRKSSSSSVGSFRSGRTQDSAPQTPGVEDNDSLDAVTVDMDDMTAIADSSSGYHSSHEDSSGGGQLSSLELENSLLKNEVTSLNHEMTSIIQRARQAQDEVSIGRRQNEAMQGSLSMSEQRARELQAHEDDLNEALSTKDAQLAILRVRLEEADKDLSSKRETVQKLQGEKDRILNDHTSSSGVHSQALDSMTDKLQEAEGMLKREQDNLRTIQQEWQDRASQLQDEKQSISDSLVSAQKKLNDEKSRCSQLNTQMKTLRSQSESSKTELSEYKEKATRILQSKDRLIAQLKSSDGGGMSGETSAVSQAELESLRQERDLLRDELQQSRMTIDGLRAEMQDLEGSLQAELDSVHETLRELEESMTSETRAKQETEHELAKLKQELRYAHEELLKQKTQFQSRLTDREEELQRLRNQLTAKSASTTSEVELENRLHALTESLIHKQTMLEAISTEKNSLGLQLERLEAQFVEHQAIASRSHTTAVNMQDDDEVRQRLPGFMRESPLDGIYARKVKRAANSIDRFSVRLGVFLRRYPIARIFVILYGVMLHVWVMVVLLTYQPEMHSHDFNPQPPLE